MASLYEKGLDAILKRLEALVGSLSGQVSAAEQDWTIEVIASEVNMDVHVETLEDDQDYALVVYGVTDMVDNGIFADGFETGDTSLWSALVP